MDVKTWLGENNQLGIDIWNNKYKFENETFDEWIERISNGNQELAQLILEKKFLFGGRILASRGLANKGKKITYSNCYVITPPEDNIESIYEAASKLARTYSYGGGCGIDISKLSPKGAKINNAAKYTSGAVSFMDTYSQVTEQIGQEGRRGALMISLDCSHPDLEEFIDIKTDLNKVTKANISIKITDDFMNAVINDEMFDLTFKREETGEYIIKTVNARKVFRRLAENNWNYGEPGCLFWDRIQSYNLLSEDNEFEYAGTNPCAEEPLPAGGSCLLGSINLAEFVTEDRKFNIPAFEKAVRIAVRALNEVLDEGLPLHALQEQRDSVRDWRQIGLGIFGLADLLIKMEIAYGSDLSIDMCNIIAKNMALIAADESANLAKEHGSYPKYKEEAVLASRFLAHIATPQLIDKIEKYGLRNSQLLTIAPTGTISTMLGVSGGIEPIFANSYTRKTESLQGKDYYYKIYTPIVDQYMKAHGIQAEEDLPKFFVTAQTINPMDRVAMQGVWQENIDASISSTVNLPYEASVEDVYNIYLEAWKRGLKGITVFRDGCARASILTTRSESNEAKAEGPARGEVIPASDRPIGLKRKLMTGCGSLHCTAFFDPDTKQLVEVYLSKGSTGGCNNFMIGLSRMISMAARGGISLDDIVDQLMSTGSCPSYAVRAATHHDTSRGSCCPMAVGYALKDMYKEFQGLGEVTVDNMWKKIDDLVDKSTERVSKAPLCPTCGEPLTFEGGCNICKACGYSKCD